MQERVARDNYFIREDYRPASKRPGENHDPDKKGVYWNASRIETSRFYQYGVYQWAQKIALEKGLRKIADVGCGTGIKLASLFPPEKGFAITGIDRNQALEYPRKNFPHGRWIELDLDNPGSVLLELKGQMELVLCCDVIEHLHEPDRLLELLLGIPNPKGLVVLSTPDRAKLYRGSVLQPHNKEHVREWTDRELRKYLGARGFTVLASRHCLPVKAAFNGLFYREVVRRLMRLLPVRYNQMHLLCAASSETQPA